MTTQEPEIGQVAEQEHAMVEESAAAPAAHQEEKALISALLGSVLYLAFFAVMTWFNSKNLVFSPVLWAAIAPLTTVAYLLILVNTIRLMCRLTLTARLETLVMAVALLAYLLINPAARDIIWGIFSGKSLQTILSTLSQAPNGFSWGEIFIPFFLIITGVYFGQLLSRIIREPALLVPVSIISGLIDFWGVYWGPVGIWSESVPSMVNMATAATAAASMPEAVRTQLPQQLKIFGNIAPPQTIGIGDFVFLAFFLTCAYRLGFSARRTMWGIFFGLLASCLVMALDGTILFGHEVTITYLPGLIFICGGALIANLGRWRLSRQEWAMTGVLTVILLAIISSFIIRIEKSKPKIDVFSFTIAPPTRTALFDQALTRAVGRHPRGEITLLGGRMNFNNTNNIPALREFELIALDRPAAPRLRTTREILLHGVLLRKGSRTWEIDVQTQIPPDTAVNLLRRTGKEDASVLIRNARGIPRGALALVDRLEAQPDSWSDHALTLRILPEHTDLFGERKKQDKQAKVLKTFDLKEFGDR